jgi:hypothetical protein
VIATLSPFLRYGGIIVSISGLSIYEIVLSKFRYNQLPVFSNK